MHIGDRYIPLMTLPILAIGVGGVLLVLLLSGVRVDALIPYFYLAESLLGVLQITIALIDVCETIRRGYSVRHALSFVMVQDFIESGVAMLILGNLVIFLSARFL